MLRMWEVDATSIDFPIARAVAERYSEDVGFYFMMERRSRLRTKTHWPVLILHSRSGVILDSTTVNLSSTGFYCLSPTLLPIGEPLICWLKIPAYEPSDRERTLSLECNVRVVRAEPGTVEGCFGIACRIEDYGFHGVDAGPSRQSTLVAATPVA